MKNLIDNIGVAAFILLIPLLISRIWITDDYLSILFYKIAITDFIILVACVIAVACYEEKGEEK